MSLGRTLKLNNGVVAPQIGFGTWQAAPGEVEKAVEEAIKVGYRHIDCALIYQNQDEVAQGIKASGVPRKDLFLVSKLWNNSHRPEKVEADLDTSLKQLGTDYLDVYLIHWPVPFAPGGNLFPKTEDGKVAIDWDGPSVVDTWKELIRISKETKKVKAIGVSNFNVELLGKLIKETGVVPTMNQIECHPSLIQPELFKYCKEKNIVITAYSPLGNNTTGKPRIIDQPQIIDIAKKLNKEPAQVLINWAAHQGFAVIPKSVTPSRIKSNFEDFKLSDDTFEEINKVGKANASRANIPAEYNPSWPINVFGEKSEEQYKKVW
ncbi:oxidoreductase [Cryptococcus neoformans Bt120]|nr:oxidoreductase [Cryptococcus neoformans var. grubii Bt120]